jgi:membrane-bound lytic murein transglycosylase D
VCLAGLAGCQLTSLGVLAEEAARDAPAAPAAAAPVATTAAQPVPPRITVIRGPGLDLEGIVDQRSSQAPAPPPDLLGRLGDELSLAPVDDPAVTTELEWYAAHPAYLQRVFRRAELYLFHIVGELERRGMPVDLALLPVVESAFDPFAYSHGRAAGLWQIIPGTGRRLGLKQNWWYDGRRDVVESTRGALDYLQRLNELFDGDWLLSVAGYNSGEGNVIRAMRRAEAAGERTDFWHIRRYLPVETRTYVPRLLAIQRLVADPAHYGVTLPPLPDEPYFALVDTGGQMDMALAAELAGSSADELYRLNPGVNRWATDPQGPHRLLVPVQTASLFEQALEGLGARERVQWSRHRVQAGETLSHLALRYHTTPAVLRSVNELRGNTIRAGQHLMIPHAAKSFEAYTHTVEARTQRRQNQPRGARRHAHVVRPGDSLWSISRRYDVGVRELANWNAMAPADPLSVGRELVVWTDRATPAPGQAERIRRLTYTVRKGDSLARISDRFRVSVTEIVKWNNIKPDRYLQPGQQLVMYVDVTEQSS